jgi:hypothetical protein
MQAMEKQRFPAYTHIPPSDLSTLSPALRDTWYGLREDSGRDRTFDNNLQHPDPRKHPEM